MSTKDSKGREWAKGRTDAEKDRLKTIGAELRDLMRDASTALTTAE